MRTYVLLAILALTSCATPVPKVTPTPTVPHKKEIHEVIINLAPDPPKISDYCKNNTCNYRKFADDLNWYMMYLFTYTKAANEYAMSHGWKAPIRRQPLCRLVRWPEATPLPVFTGKGVNSNSNEFEWELTQYIKQMRGIYNKHMNSVKVARELQQGQCLY